MEEPYTPEYICSNAKEEIGKELLRRAVPDLDTLSRCFDFLTNIETHLLCRSPITLKGIGAIYFTSAIEDDGSYSCFLEWISGHGAGTGHHVAITFNSARPNPAVIMVGEEFGEDLILVHEDIAPSDIDSEIEDIIDFGIYNRHK